MLDQDPDPKHWLYEYITISTQFSSHEFSSITWTVWIVCIWLIMFFSQTCERGGGVNRTERQYRQKCSCREQQRLAIVFHFKNFHILWFCRWSGIFNSDSSCKCLLLRYIKMLACFSLSRQFGLHFIEQLLMNFLTNFSSCRWFKEVNSPTFRETDERATHQPDLF